METSAVSTWRRVFDRPVAANNLAEHEFIVAKNLNTFEVQLQRVLVSFCRDFGILCNIGLLETDHVSP